MNVTCPQCRTVYRVDPRKVPDRGVRARCMRCPAEFDVRRVETAAADRSSAIEESADTSAPGVGAQSVEATVEATRGTTEQAGPGGETEADAQWGAEVAPAENMVAADSAPLSSLPFGSADPKARARRLARALVSDILVYHRDRRDRSLREGTIRQEFREEIRKSWDEYVAQVGNEMARETSYFQEALNEILAGGVRNF